MLTIFTIPKPFTDPHIRIIQRNALQSWKKIASDMEIILMGNDAGVEETAREFGMRHISNVMTSEFGTPLLDSAFSLAREHGRFEKMMYVNADIIFLPDFMAALVKIPASNSLTIGRRTDLDMQEEINFSDPKWQEKLLTLASGQGKLHSYAGIDYLIFDKQAFRSLPPFAVGRVGWDNWTVHEARRTLAYTIDATECITAIHQNHAYTGNNAGKERKTNPEALKNNSFTKNPKDACTIEDSNWKLVRNGIAIELHRNRLSWLPSVKRYLKNIF